MYGLGCHWWDDEVTHVGSASVCFVFFEQSRTEYESEERHDGNLCLGWNSWWIPIAWRRIYYWLSSSPGCGLQKLLTTTIYRKILTKTTRTSQKERRVYTTPSEIWAENAVGAHVNKIISLCSCSIRNIINYRYLSYRVRTALRVDRVWCSNNTQSVCDIHWPAMALQIPPGAYQYKSSMEFKDVGRFIRYKSRIIKCNFL